MNLSSASSATMSPPSGWSAQRKDAACSYYSLLLTTSDIPAQGLADCRLCVDVPGMKLNKQPQGQKGAERMNIVTKHI